MSLNDMMRKVMAQEKALVLRPELLPGVYAIYNTVNGKVYIGSAIKPRQRWYIHRSKLRRKIHENKHLQSAWDKYGEPVFEFVVVENCKAEDCILREQASIDGFKATDKKYGYNKNLHAGSSLGVKASFATKAKMSIIHKSLGISSETRKKMVASRKQNTAWHSPEARAKIAATLTGRKHTDASRAKMSATRKTSKAVKAQLKRLHALKNQWWIGRHHTEAAKAKISASAKLRRKGGKK